MWELDNDPQQPALFTKITHLRSYYIAKSKVDRAKSIADLEEERKDPAFEKMSDLAIEIGIGIAAKQAGVVDEEE